MKDELPKTWEVCDTYAFEIRHTWMLTRELDSLKDQLAVTKAEYIKMNSIFGQTRKRGRVD